MRAVLCLLLLALVAGVLSGKLFKKRRPVVIQRQPTVARTQGSGIGNKTKFNKKTGFFTFLKNKFSNIKRKFGKGKQRMWTILKPKLGTEGRFSLREIVDMHFSQTEAVK